MNLVHGYSTRGKAGCCTATWEKLRTVAGTRGKTPGARSFQRAARQELAREGTRLRKTYVAARDDSLDGIAARRRRKVLRVLTEAEVRDERRCAKVARRHAREARSREERARARQQERQERKPSAPSVVGRVLAELASRPLRLVVDNTKRPAVPTVPTVPVRPPPSPTRIGEAIATPEQIAEHMRKLREQQHWDD